MRGLAGGRGGTGAAPYEVISEQESRSVMERLEWIKNAVRRGTALVNLLKFLNKLKSREDEKCEW